MPVTATVAPLIFSDNFGQHKFNLDIAERLPVIKALFAGLPYNPDGKPLSPVDMLKAYLLAPIEDTDVRQQSNHTWKKHVLELISWGGTHEPERDSNCIKAWLRTQ